MAVLAAITVFAVGVPAMASTPSPSSTPAATTTAKRQPTLPIDIVIGRIGIHLRLPLTIPGLLGLGGSSSSTPTPPPTSSSPGGPTTQPTSPHTTPVTHTHPATTPVAVHTPTNPPPLAAGGAPGGVVGNPGPHTPTPHHSPTTSAHPSTSRHPHASNSALVLVKQLFPGPGPAILIALCIVCAIGVAAVVRVSGRRGRHLA